MNKTKKIFWIGLGLLCVGIGAVGVVLPVLPTTPFLLVASFAYTKGSDRFRMWFLSTKLYKRHLEDFEKDRSMTLKTKLCILIPVTAMLLAVIVLTKNLHVRIFIAVLIVVKYVYFIVGIETITEEEKLMRSDKRKKESEQFGVGEYEKEI